jgi:hypothetical protein
MKGVGGLVVADARRTITGTRRKKHLRGHEKGHATHRFPQVPNYNGAKRKMMPRSMES